TGRARAQVEVCGTVRPGHRLMTRARRRAGAEEGGEAAGGPAGRGAGGRGGGAAGAHCALAGRAATARGCGAAGGGSCLPGGQQGSGTGSGGMSTGGSGDDDPEVAPDRAGVFDPIGDALGERERVELGGGDDSGEVQGLTDGRGGVHNLPLVPYTDRFADYQDRK